MSKRAHRGCDAPMGSLFGGYDQAANKEEERTEQDTPAPVLRANALTLGAQGEVLERWRFDDDAYSVGLLALFRKGGPRALPEFLLAAAVPTMTILAMKLVVAHLLAQEAQGRKADLSVSLICFVLAALPLSNEALEGFSKMVFSMRGCAGVYTEGNPWCLAVGVFLGFMQCFTAIVTVGVNMQLVAAAENAIDAFTNFVALSFLTEIDNLLLSSRTVRNLFGDVDLEVTVRHARPLEDMHGAWAPCVIFLIVNALALPACALTINLYDAAGQVREPPIVHDWCAELPGAIAAAAAVNCVTWLASRVFDIVDVAFVLCLVLIVLLLSTTRAQWFGPLARMVVFSFVAVGAAGASAADFDPFPLITCPYRTPLLMVLLMVAAFFWLKELQEIGTA